MFLSTEICENQNFAPFFAQWCTKVGKEKEIATRTEHSAGNTRCRQVNVGKSGGSRCAKASFVDHSAIARAFSAERKHRSTA